MNDAQPETAGFDNSRVLLHVDVDFNCPEPYDVMPTWKAALFKVGQSVLAVDGEGYECEAVVMTIHPAHRGSEEWVIEVKPDMDKFRRTA
jgi:hypothetical protein